MGNCSIRLVRSLAIAAGLFFSSSALARTECFGSA